jgi:hypothetical protein
MVYLYMLSLACPAWRQYWIINELHFNNIGAYIRKTLYNPILAVLMRILLKILKNLNLIDTQTQLPDNSIIRNIS